MSSRATIRDVAQAAEVSPMAVSAVLNGTGGKRVTVAPQTAERIRRVARELKYRPNHLARAFRYSHTGQVALVFQNFGRFGSQSPYRDEVMNGVLEALFPNDYTLALCPKLIRDGDPGYVSDGRFDGVLWCRPDLTEESGEVLRDATIPVVMIHAPPGTVPGVPTFCADNDGAMMRAASYLSSLGHRRLAFVIDPVSVRSVEGRARAQALKNAAGRLGLPEPEVMVLSCDHAILARYAGPHAPHTALVCFSDELAGFVLRSCGRLGVSVPGDVSVMGFDSSPLCEAVRPRLTSLAQPVERIAFEAATHLLSLIRAAEEGEGSASARSALYDCELEIRESTGPPPSR